MPYQKRIDVELLAAALAGYQHQYDLLGDRIADLRRQLGSRGASAAGRAAGAFSDETRRRMSAAQKKRWAGNNQNVAKRQPKRQMSAEGRARIAAAARKRWAAYRAARKRSKK